MAEICDRKSSRGCCKHLKFCCVLIFGCDLIAFQLIVQSLSDPKRGSPQFNRTAKQVKDQKEAHVAEKESELDSTLDFEVPEMGMQRFVSKVFLPFCKLRKKTV